MHKHVQVLHFQMVKLLNRSTHFVMGSDFSNFVPDLTVSSPKFTDKFKNFGLES